MSVLSLKKALTRQRHSARTLDGWKIALHRYTSRTGTLPGQAPVFLCHGLGANRYNLDAPGRLSLARYLARRGFDCWVVELRGAGRSSRPRFYNKLHYNWTFDDYVNHDIPAALNVVRKATGQRDVHWIGHSMGGMVAYAHLITSEAPAVRSMTAIASPCFKHTGNTLLDKVIGLRKLLKLLPAVPYEGAGALVVPAMPVFKETLGRLFGNPRNLSTRDLAQLIVLAPNTLPTSLITQFANWYAEDGFADGYDNVHYYRELHRITCPAHIIAGVYDKLTPPEDIKFVYDSLGSTDKAFAAFGRHNGCRHDYGHIDLVLGRYAQTEVWPHIYEFIRAR